MNRSHLSAILQALVAALLFGASAPIAKLLLGEIEPIPLAAFLYLGSGLGLSGIKLFQRMRTRGEAQEAISRRAWVAIGLMTLASILLSFNLSGKWGFSPGALGIFI